jgi:hypothetical protein
MRRVRETIVAVKRQKVLHTCILSVHSLGYPACNGHAPYYIVVCLSVWLYLILPHYLTNGTIFGVGGGAVIDYKIRVLILSTNVSVTFLTLRKIPRDAAIYVHRSACKVSVILVRL